LRRSTSPARTKSQEKSEVVFYRCPECGYVGMYVIGGRRSGDFATCGSRWCGRGFALRLNRVSEDEYDLTWGRWTR